MKHLAVYIWLITLPVACLASRSDPYEEMFDDVEEDHDYLDLINQLDMILKQPINLLEADADEIAHLPWVSPWLARDIISLRQRGELKSIDDLRKIDGIDDRLRVEGLPVSGIRTLVRTGDTPSSERTRMTKRPPQILVTTPESLYILLTSRGGRAMLETARSEALQATGEARSGRDKEGDERQESEDD